MSSEPEKPRPPAFFRRPLAQHPATPAQTDEYQSLAPQESETFYEPGNASRWLEAALGTLQGPADRRTILTLTQTKDLANGALAPVLIHRKGGGHG